MEKYIGWYDDNTCRHFDNIKELLDSTPITVTVEFYSFGNYVGEVDYTIDDFIKNYT